MKRSPRLRVLFRAAAGPRRGFGHLVRCRSLARALGVPFHLSLRATPAVRRAARLLGARVQPDGPGALAAVRPDLVVIDDPSGASAARWVARAHRAGLPAVVIDDLGIGRVAADLTVDGSVWRPADAAPADLGGPRYAILDPVVSRIGARRSARVPGRVLVSLGGGEHVLRHGPRLAAEIRRQAPGAEVVLIAGFEPSRIRPALPPRCRWQVRRQGLSRDLGRSQVAVLGGGVTLYEAAAVATPAVALSVVPGQRRTVEAFADAGAAVDAGRLSDGARTIATAAASVRRLLASPALASRLVRAGRRLVDGRGAVRVAAHVRTLALAGLEGRRVA